MNNLSVSSNPALARAKGGLKPSKQGGKPLSAGGTKPAPTSAPGAVGQPKLQKEVTFELNANNANEVLLAGDFTGWEQTPIKLTRSDRGAWHATVKLAPGQYHYKFLVDGQWQDDPCASSSCPNPYGSCNSVLKVS